MTKILLGATLAFFLIAPPAPPALAHRVHIFAYVSQGALLADCRFAKDRPARNAEIIVYDAKSGEELLRGRSDDKGVANIPLTPELLHNPVDLRLVLKAGEGHQGEWEVAASALQGQSATPAPEAPATPSAPQGEAQVPEAPVTPSVPQEEAQVPEVPATPSAPQEEAPASPAPVAAAGNTAKPAELEAVINRALDAKLDAKLEAKLAPIQAMLAAQMAANNASGPGFTEILGGLGWIVGIFGMRAWCSARRKRE